MNTIALPPLYKMVTSPLFALPDPNRHPMFSIPCPILSFFRFLIGFDGGDESNVRSLVEQAAYIKLFTIHFRSFSDRRAVPVRSVTHCLNTPNYIWILLKNSTSIPHYVHSAYVTTNGLLIPYKENVTICCGNHTEHVHSAGIIQNTCTLQAKFIVSGCYSKVTHSYYSTLVKYYPFHS